MENKEEKVEKLEAAPVEDTTSQTEPSEGGAAVVAVKQPGFGQKIANTFKNFFTREHLKEFTKNHIFDICALGGAHSLHHNLYDCSRAPSPRRKASFMASANN